jgi:hypothetical protein
MGLIVVVRTFSSTSRWHYQLNAKNLYIRAGTRKLSLVFFLYDPLSFRHL